MPEAKLLDVPWPEDARLAEVYDVECAGRWDHDFYLALATELGAESVVDIGCGTGVFAVDVAARGMRATGVDPAAAVLDIARARPGGDSVDWVHGTPSALPTASANLAVMMGHVAQYFLTDDEWATLLAETTRLLVPGGHLAFETRNPALDWASRWTKQNTTEVLPHPRGGDFTSWVQVVDRATTGDGYTMTHEGNTVLPDGSHLRAAETLRFRSPAEVRQSLATAGFEIEQVWGGWNRETFDSGSTEMIVLARSAPTGERP